MQFIGFAFTFRKTNNLLCPYKKMTAVDSWVPAHDIQDYFVLGKTKYDQMVFEAELNQIPSMDCGKWFRMYQNIQTEDISGTSCVFNHFLKPSSDLSKT